MSTASTSAYYTRSYETPTLRNSLKRGRFWAIVAAIAIVGALLTTFATGSVSVSGDDLDPNSPAPNGAKAVVSVLDNEGVTVHLTQSLEDTKRLADENTTVLIAADSYYLDEDQIIEAATLGASTVLVSPGFSTLQSLGYGIGPGQIQANQDPLSAGCSYGPAKRAGTISATGVSYPLPDADDAIGCFETDDGGFGIVRIDDGGHPVTILGVTDVLRNETIVDAGNAALALGLLGEHDNLIWYTPGIDDLGGEEVPDTLADLTPPWVSPAIILAMIAALAAAIWRGRRLGPLTVENLPVTVKAQETMEGRARMYAAAGASGHAAHSLRSGSMHRMALLIGVSPTAEELTPVVATLTGWPQATVYSLLSDDQTASDRLSDGALIDLARNLQLCEDIVRRTITGGLDRPPHQSNSDSPVE
ncbi:DUF4350 domain-containing protein [Lysinibacter cavernae]|uniref:DUF4350 domain-containing protein n=1 Tax=Lysinibacter cavernae TaxID=1640652 RepID=A0A7X5R1F1_9MICO|nr:DUF4350 domain-containing protein [Lysinibacter cavernae]NIH53816.1 hypothetical protein [Lysinibacter cavernae]